MNIALPSIVNPKPARSGAARASCWYRYYAMFSERFAEEVLATAGLCRGAVVLDPWLGSGTTMAVAARSKLCAIGVDINPAMIAIANGRCVGRYAAVAAVAAVEKAARAMKASPAPEGDPLSDWFGPSAAGALRRWQQLIQTVPVARECPRVAGFLLTALFEAAWSIAGRYRTKNPTWVRKPTPADRADESAVGISKSVLAIAAKKAETCQLVSPRPSTVLLGTSTQLDVPARRVDFVLTSPPYCTRIDYAISTRVELAVLGFSDTAVAALRDSMMGTSTIRQAEPAAHHLWGVVCNELLAHVLHHPSKSSANYYYKTFVQYFADLHASLREIDRCAKSGAGVVLVVQDSRYKGTKIDLAAIVTEMAAGLWWKATRRDDHVVCQTMRRVNTRSRLYRADASSTETVLWFKTAAGG
jgi:ubiquinone/menaquinone biosynthesis C-methylase UbiE